MVGLYKDPTGENIFLRSSRALTGNNNHSSMAANLTSKPDDDQQIATLKMRIKGLEEKLEACEANVSV